MKFKELYQENCTAVKETLKAMWCSNSISETQRKYAEKIESLIDNELFTSEKYMPLVQCMDRYKSTSHEDEALKIVGGLWGKAIGHSRADENYYPPYEHQYEAWKALSNTEGPKNSMVVTTGTGSGKTECFMLPLVKDLLDNPNTGQIEAIFLYPLNALMEDQKDRLQTLLEDTHIKFAVYNGNLPETDNESQRKLHERIQEERTKYNNIVPTRAELHTQRNRPNILLTNPTMLEYMLLRKKDQCLFTPGSLKWIVIDETHTFSGAGAAELAMLLRRVLSAFDVKPSDVRFATSSATIGNAKNDEEKKENDEKLRQFISDISGVNINQVKLITGDRVPSEISNDVEKERCRRLLSNNDYVRLDEMFPNGNILEKLERLDEMCEGEDAPLKAKLHLFYRVPNNGLRVRLDRFTDGVFDVFSAVPADSEEMPYLELMRCSHCGEYFAAAESVPDHADQYRALTSSSSDLFDFDSKDQSNDKILFSLTNKQSSQFLEKDGNILEEVKGNTHQSNSNAYRNGWSILANVQKCCPHCHSQVIGHKENKSNRQDDNGELENEINENVVSFRMSAPFISRVLAPSCLQQMRKSNDPSCPHHGQQYISFVDSRQAAARSTMQQNIDQERIWVYSRLFNKLNERKQNANGLSIQKELERVTEEINIAVKNEDYKKAFEKNQELVALKGSQGNAFADYMTWGEVFDYLRNETPECEQLCYQFANKNEQGSELKSDDSVEDEVKSKYVYSVMLEQLGKRPRKPAAPETLGLFTTYYPKLENIRVLPEEVNEFNSNYLQNGKQIDLVQWKNFLKNFLDYVVRSNESVYLRVDNSNLDITACQRFETTKPPRRPIHKPEIKDDDAPASIYSNSVLFLAKLIDPDSDNLRETAFNHRTDINAVLNAMWRNLKDDAELIRHSSLFKNGNWEYDYDKDDAHTPQYRLNVDDIAFKLYEDVCLCDTRLRGEQFEVLRPIEYNTLFMGFSPYPIDGIPVNPRVGKEEWQCFPYLNGLKDGNPLTRTDVEEWASKNRAILWENGIWGENGCFSNRLTALYLYPEIFVQAEHTAQVDKLVSKQSQDKFKEQKINILACSTTMEMGVDLGNLELVFMTSIPPHPSNYKQRAGRSGRNKDTRSVCITLCGSDAVGLRTLNSPMDQIIKRPMAVPFVDLKSPQVIQRHVNAFLFRTSRLFFENPRGNANNLDQEIIEFFTPFHFVENEKGKSFSIEDSQNNNIFPDSLLGEKDDTRYSEFKNYLEGDDITLLDNTKLNVVNAENKLKTILQGTCYAGESTDCISRCKQEIERCYDELLASVTDISESYIQEKERLENSSKVSDQQCVAGSRVDSGYGYYLRHKYSEVLSKNIITYLATNRFTPNANMPVEILEFNKSLKYESGRDFSTIMRKSNNPSYTLREAISQYSPGNTIVLENRTIVVRGLLYTGMYKQTATFKKIYSDGITTVVDTPSRIPADRQIEWPINERKDLTLIEPVAFIPDINESESRVVGKNPYTQVSAQLIGANMWNDTNSSSSLFMTRNNLDCGEAKILYYNEGVGFGYAFCRDCGKTVLETHAAQQYANLNEMQNEKKKDANGKTIDYHYKINRNERNGRKSECGFSKKIERNVIIGGLIQTDYTEIKIRMGRTQYWVDSKYDYENLLITLGIVFTNQFVEYLGKDRNDVDFVIMPNAHLCIFDTNPGGSGYSNQLSSYVVMQEVLKQSLVTLKKVSSREELLDKYTVRYLDKLDIPAAASWIESALEALRIVPDEIKDKVGEDVCVAFYENILEHMKNGAHDIPKVLFVNSQWEKWLYTPENKEENILGWKQRVQDFRGLNLTPDFCITDCETVPLPIYSILESIKDWAKVKTAENSLPKGLFPIALIGDKMFFTVDESVSGLNQDWARGQLYCTSKSHFGSFDYREIDTSFIYNEDRSKNVKFTLENDKKIYSKELGKIVAAAFDPLVKVFKAHCESRPNDKLEIVYQDEHLKSVLGMVTTLQFIDYFIGLFNNKPFHLTFRTEEYYEGRPCYNISNNYQSDVERNEKLKELTDGWLTSRLNRDDVADLYRIETLPDKSLPHWRELRITCADKSLVIYPNGGIINEWFLAGNSTQRPYRLDDTTVDDSLPLYRKKEIKYDAEVVTE